MLALTSGVAVPQTYLAIMKEEGYKMPVALKLEAHSLFHQVGQKSNVKSQTMSTSAARIFVSRDVSCRRILAADLY